ncbi:hypothetical protein H4O18_15265 [Arenibacter sp. BSSL-BM3]|uniref:Uncharacterized protein n=1 Tax=Arenibacter arenosicollis TaxID=2762274 RepID=A0ABR7QQA4_9FLAO|nr:hypothetical protein [Arenibacter arenosicollis]MBC8769355.1 hypothetical protein [Arenibacter arenosicollis]
MSIDFEKWEKLCEYNQAMKLYNEFDISWCLLIDNLNELQLFINKHISRKKISTDFKKEGYLRHLNYKLINAISSVYIFYNNVIGLVERNFDDETVNEIDAIFKKMYDDSKVYRFSYQLRGYVNHKNLPINVLDSDLSSDELILTLNTYKLFNSSYSWNAKVKKEFEDAQEISIKTIIINLFAVYFEYYPMILKAIKDKLQPYNKIIDELELKFNPNQTHTLRVMWDLDKRVEEIIKQMKPFSQEELIRIIQKENLNNLLEVNLNLTANEVFEQRLGYTLAPDHFHMYHSGLRNKFNEK